MLHRIRIAGTFARLGALNELQYRANFWANLLVTALGLLTAFGGLAVIFQHTDSVGGWQAAELVALVGVFHMVRGAIRSVVQPSMEAFMDSVRKGTLDFVLTKPEDAQLLVSFQRIALWSLTDLVMGAVVLILALGALEAEVGWGQAVGLAVALLSGAVIVYSFFLILATFAFWFVKVENILVIFQSMYQAGQWPVGIYPTPLRLTLTFLVPVAFAVTVPAEAAVGRMSPMTLLFAVGLAAGLFMGARWFWRIGIRHYSGASA
jgi:ABC-2 type transport system permease protein